MTGRTKRTLSALAFACTTLVACGKPAINDAQVPPGKESMDFEDVVLEGAANDPLVKISRRYLCEDARIVQLNFMDDDFTVEFGANNNAETVVLTSAGPDSEFFAGQGYSLRGSGKHVVFERPGQPPVQCDTD